MAAARLGRWLRRSAWPCNVLLYSGLFAAGDAAQQRLRGRQAGHAAAAADWTQTRHVALVALTFHGNFNYVWLRALERLLPGRAPRAVLAKVLCDQLMGAPVAVLAFYTGEWEAKGASEHMQSTNRAAAWWMDGWCPVFPASEKSRLLPTPLLLCECDWGKSKSQQQSLFSAQQLPQKAKSRSKERLTDCHGLKRPSDECHNICNTCTLALHATCLVACTQHRG